MGGISEYRPEKDARWVHFGNTAHRKVIILLDSKLGGEYNFKIENISLEYLRAYGVRSRIMHLLLSTSQCCW